MYYSRHSNKNTPYNSAPKPVISLTKFQVEFIEDQGKKGNDFFQSLFEQWARKRGLSERQIQCIDNAMVKAGLKEAPKKEFTYKVGDKITIKKWIANKLAESQGMEFFFRNLEISEMLDETSRAIEIKVKFVSDIQNSCHMCGRSLDCEISRATGIGPVCIKKIGVKRPSKATAQEMLKAIDQLTERIGEIGPIWIPKSQIV